MRNFSRRGFLGLLATGAVGACVAAKIPTAFLPAKVRTRAACEFLRDAYMAHYKSRGVYPREMRVGRELFEAFEGELVVHERFVEAWVDDGKPYRRGLAFKGARVYEEGRGWVVRFAS